jgi:hypothetical protein
MAAIGQATFSPEELADDGAEPVADDDAVDELLSPPLAAPEEPESAAAPDAPDEAVDDTDEEEPLRLSVR